jgi:tetratricopeptide (TPR) repeat protein
VRAEVRRQLKQDKFSRTTIEVAEKTVHWTVEHKTKLIASAAVLVVVVLAALGSWYYLEQQDERASVDLGRASQALERPLGQPGMPAQPDFPSFASSAERATEARKQFQAIAVKYPHTRAADFSHYFIGVTSATLGDNATAERELKAVSAYRNQDLSALGKLALASLYRKGGRTKDAVELYRQLMAQPARTVSKGSAEIELAETYQEAGMVADAKKQYEQIKKEAPQSPAAQLASAKLEDMK